MIAEQTTERFLCYDCEDYHHGKPYFTIIPATKREQGAFLCEECFAGLEKRGYVPDSE
jgi:hypothetical protein